MTRGFSNWKEARTAFKNHEKSASHKEAVETMVTIPSTTKDVSVMLSKQFGSQKVKNQQALYHIISCIRYLCRQGLSIRGDKDETNGNLQQLLRMKAEEDTNLKDWLRRKENVYTSPDIQNEIIKLMGLQILRNITSELQCSPFLAIMADETTDSSNTEQVTLFFRSVSDDFEVQEEFIGLYHVPSIDAATLSSVIQDVFARMNLSLGKLRGQCYDGASSMSGSKSGVAKRISDLESRAVFTHCYGHALNLAACDTIKKIKLLKDALEVTYEVTKLIKYSPRRQQIFYQVKENMSSSSDSPGIRVLCPTRWTVRAESLGSVVKNYEVLMQTWEEAAEIVKDSETKARIRGVAVQMKSFNYVFGNLLGEMLLKHADNLSRTLQSKSLSAAEGQTIAGMTVDTLSSLRNDASFDLFWAKVNDKATKLGVNDPQLPRKRKPPARYDDGLSQAEFHDNPKSYFRQIYFEALDLIISCITDRFSQPGYEIYKSIESVLSKACNQEDFTPDLDVVCDFYRDDFNKQLLQTQLEVLKAHCKHNSSSSFQSIFDVKQYFLSLSSAQLSLLSEAKRLLQLMLVMPATNASSERSFSALRHVKTYLRATMNQDRLNYLMLLHIHKERTDKLDLKLIVNQFIGESQHRSSIFAKYF